ncbi:16250_t:CDS:2 [Funneliformis mosseae]|uniref:16250_t:CDS:1 n=1 Tax=Funneliformis mosseae TaxID=27381 RepID=A0A9N9BIM7_FUNMO|nr:16250_t:CDS:2 [Funneliformis mosseae]
MELALNLLAVYNEEISQRFPNNEDHKIINDIMNLLKPIERATCLLSASNYVTHEHLIQYKNDDEFSQCIMANAIYQKLEDYLPILDKSSQISSLLDLRVKLSVFKGENEINKAKDLILKLNGYLLTFTSTIASISDDITNTRNFFR